MSEALRKNKEAIFRSDSGVLSAAETVAPNFDLSGYRQAILHIRQVANLATPDLDDVVNFFVDTAYGDADGGGPRWVNVARISYDQGDDGTAPEAVVVIGGHPTTNTLSNDIQSDLGSEGVRANVPLGDRLRIRTTVAGATAPSYRYEALLSVRGG